MIQFNLLPDVKLQFIRAQRRKRLVMIVSFISTGATVLIFVLLFMYVRVAQQHNIKDLTNDINDKVKKIQSTGDIDKVLTIQNQLNSLPELHNQKVISSRLFDYLTQLTPAQVTISDVNIDFAANTLSIKGNADTLTTVNQFADTLKFTDYKTTASDPKEAKEGKAFKEVVLRSFSVAAATQGSNKQTIGYELGLSFDPIIFANLQGTDNGATVSLVIPNIITTRSETEKPTNLFVPQPTKAEGQGQ